MKKIRKLIKKSEQPLALLGGLSANEFLSEYWHKKPLLIRGAIPNFTGLLSPEELAGLACEEDVQSRLISYINNQWKLERGAFDEKRFAKLPDKNWTLLVQEVNHHLPEAAALLQQFNFIPHARLDDLMVSYAPDGGGVGPHFDSYDVFLLQGLGKRLWRIGEQQDSTLIEGAPCRILKNFTTEQEWVLEAGDMLYLPPKMAHWGIAVGDCMTYSIGFRVPSTQELATQFLIFMQDKCDLPGMYADPNLKLQKHPAKISSAMLDQVAAMLKNIAWDKATVADFLGAYLTEPKSHVVFDAPRHMTEATFKKRVLKSGVALGLKSQMLFHGEHFFLNGEQLSVSSQSVEIMRQLADTRQLSPAVIATAEAADADLVRQLYEWYLAGYVTFANS